MNRTLGWSRHTRYGLMTAALAAALMLGGCGDDDDDDWTETYQNCQAVDYGNSQQYTLCCTVTCKYHWDDDEYVAQCQESRTCTTASGGACPSSVTDGIRYPPCPY